MNLPAKPCCRWNKPSRFATSTMRAVVVINATGVPRLSSSSVSRKLHDPAEHQLTTP